ncbi:chemotaxis protein CheX [Aliiglaciecola litoralis]|uniref:Chemotaxis protein CheX n=1 Tax=Aliiglaciecola litoralis TaxID=582857 RepID=A0ABN1LSM1_9ALTE
MNVEFINPFIASLTNVLKTMAQTELKPGKPKKKSDTIAHGDVSGMIGLVGESIQGSLSITFEESLALEIMHRMLGEKPTEIDDDVSDMVGEIANMVCGGAKLALAEHGHEFGMATPIVVSGKNHSINHLVDGPKMIMPFTHECGTAYLEICFNK